MPAEPAENRPWLKTMDFVDGLKGKLPDEELAVIKRYAEKRSREATQAQVTVTSDDTVQYCSPCSPNPDMPSDVCIELKSNSGKMDPERGELESPSAGTGLETPGQQCPERGDVGPRTNHRLRLLNRGRGFKPRRKRFFNYDGKRGHASR